MSEREQVCRRCKAEIERLRSAVAPLDDIGKQLASQDNAGTSHPMFGVEELVRIYGFDSDYTDKFEWHNRDGDVVGEDDESDDCEKVYYQEDWQFIGGSACFTRTAAQRFIDENKHNYRRKLQIYVYSAHGNSEWQAVREVLAKIANFSTDFDDDEDEG